MRYLKPVLLIMCLLFSAGKTMSAEIKITDTGVFSIGGIDFFIMHKGPGFKPSFISKDKNGITYENGFPHITDKRTEVKADWKINSQDTGFSYISRLDRYKQNCIDAAFNFKSEKNVRTKSFDLIFVLDRRFFGQELKIDGDVISLPASSRKFQSITKENVKSITATCSKFILNLKGNFKKVSISDNSRAGFRITIPFDTTGYIRTGELKLKAEVTPINSNSYPLTFNNKVNASIVDHFPGTHKNTFRNLRKYQYGNINFEIASLKANQGKNLILLSRDTNDKYISEIEIPLQKDKEGSELYLLHSQVYGKEREGGSIEVKYANGSTKIIPIRSGIDVTSIVNSKRTSNSVPIFSQAEAEGDEYKSLQFSRFSLGDEPVDSIVLHGGWRTGWLVAAATLSDVKVNLDTLDSVVYMQPGDDWVSVGSGMKAPVAGSAFDFSFMKDAPAGKYGKIIVNKEGHFAGEKAPDKNIRFCGPNLCFDANFLEKNEAEKFADEMVMMGYNAVRFHHFDNTIRKEDADKSYILSPEKLDKLDYLFHCLKERGIYLTIDLYCSRYIPEGEIPGLENTKGRAIKSLAPVYEPARENWRQFVRNLLGHTNPYTGMRWADDPALFGVSLLNENTVFDVWNREPAKQLYLNRYYKYLQDKGIDTPEKRKDRGSDFLKVLCNTQIEMIREMKEFLKKEIGYNGLITDANFRDHMIQLSIRNELDFVDSHHYGDHPRGWRFFGQGFYTAAEAYVQKLLFPDRIYGKPFTVTEINYTFPNMWRAESAPLIGAYASLQDWDGLFRFAWAHSRDALLRKENIYMFDIVQDPIHIFSERIINLLFLRRDASAGINKFAFPFGDKDFKKLKKLVKGAARASRAPKKLEKLGLTSQIGMLPEGESFPGVTNLEDKPNFLKDVSPGIMKLQRNPITSDTRQIFLDTKDSASLKVVTPKTEVILLEEGNEKGGIMEVSGADSYQVISASSLDESDIKNSQKIVLFHLTDVTNNMMRFSSEKRTEVTGWGKANDLLVRRGKAKVSLALAGKSYDVTALNLDGSKKYSVPGTYREGKLEFTVDTVKGCMSYLITPR